MKYFVIYNVLGKNISGYIPSENNREKNFQALFGIMKAGMRNGDVIVEIEDQCDGVVSGSKNAEECRRVLGQIEYPGLGRSLVDAYEAAVDYGAHSSDEWFPKTDRVDKAWNELFHVVGLEDKLKMNEGVLKKDEQG